MEFLNIRLRETHIRFPEKILNDLTAVRFASKLVRTNGAVGDDDISALKAAGYGDAEVIEIVLHASLNILAGIIIRVGEPGVDFPLIQPRKAD